MKNWLELFNNRFEQAEERVSLLEDKSIEITQAVEQKGKKNMKKKKQNQRDVWDNIMHTNKCIVEIPEGGAGEK